MFILDFLFPVNCFECSKGKRYFCETCLLKVRLAKPVCPVCSKGSIDGMTHAICKTPLGLDGLLSIYEFDGVIKKGIHELKYNFVEDCAGELSELVVKNLREKNSPLKNFTLVPIPLHRLRKNWRGFNQAEVVGKQVAKLTDWNYNQDLIVRTSKTKPQVDLDEKERKENVKGVFEINSNCKLRSDSLVLFDDVWTTGSTMKEACKVLKRNGAKSVWGLTLAS